MALKQCRAKENKSIIPTCRQKPTPANKIKIIELNDNQFTFKKNYCKITITRLIVI